MDIDSDIIAYDIAIGEGALLNVREDMLCKTGHVPDLLDYFDSMVF